MLATEAENYISSTNDLDSEEAVYRSNVSNVTMAETPLRQPISSFAIALRHSLCSHGDYLYFSDTVLSHCGQEPNHILHQVQSNTDNATIASRWRTSCAAFWWQHLVAGGAAGAASRSCTAPLDRLKCMFMVYGSRTNNLRLATVVRRMLEEGGVTSLWRGNAINIVKVIPEMALKFMIYEQIKCAMKVSTGCSRDLGIAERFVAGSLAGALAQSAIYPLEVLKTRLVLRNTGQYSSALDCAEKIWLHDGIRGFYRGFIPNALGILPYAGIDLAVYETLKRRYISRQSVESEPPAVVLLVCAIVSSSCGQLVTYPLTLVRTRLQANVAIDGTGTMTGTFRSILTSDGVAGLYRGLAANFLKVAPAVSISYIVYEKTRGLLGVQMT